LRTRSWIIRAGIALTALVLLADAFVAPPLHDVHSIGALALSAEVYESDSVLQWLIPSPPTEHLGEIGCHLAVVDSPPTCSGTTAGSRFPSLVQRPNTLYLVWPHHLDTSTGHGPFVVWTGYNLEYFPLSRTIVVHLFTAVPWLFFHPYAMGMGTAPIQSLLAISTEGIGAGPIKVVEDDRLEHLIGDQSTETQLATTTIS
jgi:hypothetical protein